jgi:hypothetical protein
MIMVTLSTYLKNKFKNSIIMYICNKITNKNINIFDTKFNKVSKIANQTGLLEIKILF